MCVCCVVQLTYHYQFVGGRSFRAKPDGRGTKIPLVTDVVLQETPLQHEKFCHIPVIFNTFNDVTDKLLNGKIQLNGNVVVLVLGNTKIMKYPGFAQVNAFTNLIEALVISKCADSSGRCVAQAR